MPELPVKEVRLPELQLPEFDRAEIVRALSEIHRPAIDLPNLERPTAQLREGLARIDWGRMDPTIIDLGRVVAGIATLARTGKPILRSRWTLGVGTLVVIGLAGAALLSNPAVRERAGRTIGGVRARIDARTADVNVLDVEADEVPQVVSDIDLETLTTMVDEGASETPAESVGAG